MNIGFQDHFSGHAASYASFRPLYPPALAATIAHHAPSRDVCVECGCGNGQLTLLLAEHFQHVEASDASAEQVRHAIQHEHVRYHIATAESLPLASHSADAIVVAQAAHWFALDSFYAEVRRVAKPHAVLALACYGSASLDGPAGEVLRRFHYDTLGPYWPPARAIVEAGYRTLDFPFHEISVPPLTMEASWSAHQLIGYVNTWSAVRALEKSGKDVLIRSFEHDLLAAWGPPQSRKLLHWPLMVRMGRVD